MSSLILLLLVVILWMASQSGVTPSQPTDLRAGLTSFFGVYVVLILIMGLWSRALSRRLAAFNAHLSVRRFHKTMYYARVLVPVIFGLGVFWLGWGWIVNERLGAVPTAWPVKLPNVVIGIAPAILAWMGLWWSQYPADRALREQSLLLHLEVGAPIQAPPRFLRYLMVNFRLQIVMVIVPVLLVIATRDVIVVGARLWEPTLIIGDNVDAIASLVAVAIVYVFAPEVLRRLLDTRSLPASPLRARLDRLCQRTNMRARDILIWRTNSLMGNAAVMGLFPRIRYVLMSDLLLETMTDEQIEAVFAHEIGHVKYRHMVWYVVLVACFALLSIGPGAWVDARLVERFGRSQWLDLGQALASVGLFWIGFTFVSRRFERQADVFAARTVQNGEDLVAGNTVGPFGAALFASALRRVATINQIPIKHREWIHGSIAGRMDFVQWLAESPNRTYDFDRVMGRLYLLIITLVLVAGTAVWMMEMQK